MNRGISVSSVLQTINFFVRREDFHGRKFLGHEQKQEGTKKMFQIAVSFSYYYRVISCSFEKIHRTTDGTDFTDQKKSSSEFASLHSH